jgi:outer membrane lipoprotein SlyB
MLPKEPRAEFSRCYASGVKVEEVRQINKKQRHVLGATIGGAAGGLLGALVAGPIGALVGAAVASYVGHTIEELR